jgi:hypothetical protein
MRGAVPPSPIRLHSVVISQAQGQLYLSPSCYITSTFYKLRERERERHHVSILHTLLSSFFTFPSVSPICCLSSSFQTSRDTGMSGRSCASSCFELVTFKTDSHDRLELNSKITDYSRYTCSSVCPSVIALKFLDRYGRNLVSFHLHLVYLILRATLPRALT